MNILQEIIKHKYKEVEYRKVLLPISVLEKSDDFERETFSLKKSLVESKNHGIIAEFKRKSPSKGAFNDDFSIEEITTGYVRAGASALSVLTDEDYFGGSLTDLVAARNLNDCPILRKDFMIDEYQIIAAKACGADAILLIAAAIDSSLLNKLAKFAKSMGLEVVLEIKEKSELEGNISEYIDVVGVNNRNLENFQVDINNSKEIAKYIPNTFVKISESGISTPEAIKDLETYGYQGFLMGEAFMQTANPVLSCTNFIQSLT